MSMLGQPLKDHQLHWFGEREEAKICVNPDQES